MSDIKSMIITNSEFVQRLKAEQKSVEQFEDPILRATILRLREDPDYIKSLGIH
ncbi:hypothetical protein [Citricoccus nitrophenolicus]|uniref:hypothetical protein n=1 Tax=Citricoccus nitrophenolicus TaxID=863575 RepID=UPI0031F073EE